MKAENILVIGGNGKTGRRVANNLKDLGHNVRVVGRTSVPAFEWEKPESYDVALKDMDRAYVVYYPDLAVPGARDAIRTITQKGLKAGLKKVVLLSGKGEAEAEACEQIVANSGLAYTLVRASWFNQNFSEGAFLEFVQNGEVALPMPDARIPFVDVNDIAEVVSKVLMQDRYDGQTITVTGPKKHTFEEVVQLISDGLGRPIQFIPISIGDFKAGMKKAGMPDSYIWLFGYLFEEVLGNPENQDISKDIEDVLGRKATSFDRYVENTVKSGVWSNAV